MSKIEFQTNAQGAKVFEAMQSPFIENRVLFADSYKYSQPGQYPNGVIRMDDYMESRGGEYPTTFFFGLQYQMMRYFTTPIQKWEVDEAAEYMELHGEPFEYDGWMYIVNELGGWLPIDIKAVEEGAIIPVKVPLVTITSTDERVFWVAGWFETFILKAWAPITIASRTRAVLDTIEEFRTKTGGLEGLGFAYHDFSDRGCSSVETAGIAGMSRLAAGSMGTDNSNSLRYARKFYGATMAGFSIVASEHSTVTSWGKDGEFDMYEAYIERYKSKAIIACVMDSYNIDNAVDYITKGTFKKKIESDDYPIFVIRPDSGEPIAVIKRIIDIMEANGIAYEINHEGYKVWKKYSMIWGDGIDLKIIRSILEYVTGRGYSAACIGFGSGGWGSQALDRDTQKFAVKCSSITYKTTPDGNGGYNTATRDVFKSPVDDKGKESKKGILTTYYDVKQGKYFAGQRDATPVMGIKDVLETVWKNGQFYKTYTLDEVRENSKKPEYQYSA